MEAKAVTEQGQLKRTLKLPQLFFIGMAYLSPAAVTMYFGILSVLSGGHYPIVIAITAVAMLFTAISYAKMTRRYPVAGSVYTYTQKTMNPHLGFMVGWAMLADYLLLPMVCYLSFGIYLNVTMPSVPIWVWIIIGVLIVTLFNLRGITVASTVDTIISLLGIAALVVTIILAVIYVFDGGGEGTLFATDIYIKPESFTMTGVLAASAILAVGFLGFDAVSTMAEETVNPEKTIGRAAVLICLGAGLLWVVTAIIMNAAWPNAFSEVTDPDSAITEFYVKIGYPMFNYIFIVLNSVCCIAICITGQMAVSRIMYSMGRDGFLPQKVFGYLSPKTGVPVYNILIAGIVGLVAIIFQGNMTGAASLVSFGALVGFFFVNLSVVMQYWVKDRKRGGKAVFQYIVIPAIGAVVILYLFFSLETNAKIIGGIWLAAGLVYLLFKTKGLRQLPPQIEL